MAPLTARGFAVIFLAVMPAASGFTASKAVLVSSVQTRTSPLRARSSQHERRDFLIRTVASVGTAIAIPSVANAGSGASSNIVMPNYIEYLIEKNQQTDPSDMLYQGPDPETQLRRIGEAGSRLPEIASLAEEKKWSQIQGIITGPLGTLLQTMNNVASTKEAKDAAKIVKADILEIGVAAGRKESTPCVKAASKAAKDLEKFVMVAFK
ncbi:hypothetical protein ACHAWF_016775 [Thalassiosira exigua]